MLAWVVDFENELFARPFGCLSLAGLATAHACIVLGGRRDSDPARSWR